MQTSFLKHLHKENIPVGTSTHSQPDISNTGSGFNWACKYRETFQMTFHISMLLSTVSRVDNRDRMYNGKNTRKHDTDVAA